MNLKENNYEKTNLIPTNTIAHLCEFDRANNNSMKILNLYAGIGGNRKLWGNDHEITAVELNQDIAKIYQDFYPNDNVIIGDAHEYLINNFSRFDFIWSSPPCPTHSRMNYLKMEQGMDYRYADVQLWQEIIFLKYWSKVKYCIENVISYYEPIYNPYESENHFFWSNFKIPKLRATKRGLIRTTIDDRIDFMQNNLGINLDNVNCSKTLKSKVLSNCVNPELGLHILNCALNIITQPKSKQQTLTL